MMGPVLASRIASLGGLYQLDRSAIRCQFCFGFAWSRMV